MKTVFVIGAGANVEIGMPSGKMLKNDIIKTLDFSSFFRKANNKNIDIYFAMQQANRSDQEINNTASIIKKALPHTISIDNFIDMHRDKPDIALCGKLAIIYCILKAEKNSSLYKFINYENDNLLNTWYPLFFQKISENCDLNDFIIRMKDISFIIFNYDRCFEYYMINVIQIVYKTSRENAEKIVEEMNIIHPYGKIDDLQKVPLGAELNSHQLLKCAANIRTFTEDSEETINERKDIIQLINKVNRIIFLGFAYHPMNLDIIFKRVVHSTTAVILTNHIYCYGTGYEISENDRKHVEFLLKQCSFRVEICDISNVSCTQFFRDFWYRLSFQK